MTEVKLAEVGKFYTIADSTFAEYGVKKGDLIYLAGSGHVPVTASEPDLLRITFTAARTKGGHVLAGPGDKPFLVQNKRLVPISSAKQEKYKAIMEEDFTTDETTD